jgi:crotonobetainyl-CoA:carnitine CoA-transferase CaiB-like acyl-CoA transferase
MEHFIAGPWCSQVLADAGADVIKIERPGVGDPRRSYDPFVEQEGTRVSGGFASYNRNKRSVTLDVMNEEARDLFLRLVDQADVIVENLRPGLMNKAGLSYETLIERNPRLVYCAISGFGRDSNKMGDFSDWPAFDPIVQAMGGLASLTGEKDGPPTLGPAGSTDLLAGTWAAMGILLALMQRAVTGRGQFLDVSMYDVTVSFLGRPLMIRDWAGITMSRGSDTFTPVGLFRCGDGGYVAIIMPTEEMWRRACTAVGRTDLLSHERLQSNLQRSENMSELIVPAFEEWAADKKRRDVCESLIGTGVPAGMVQTIDDVYQCPHLAARDMFATIDDPVAGRHRYPRFPVLFSDFEPSYERTPRLGEHNAEILGELGFTEADLEDLRQRGVS